MDWRAGALSRSLWTLRGKGWDAERAFRVHRSCALILRGVLASLALACASTGAQAQPANLTLVNGGPSSAMQPLKITWTESTPPLDWSRVSLELDGVDITALAERTASGTTLQLPVPLTPGSHVLRMVFSQPDGGLAEWAQWTFTLVGQPRWNGDADIALGINQRLLNRGALVAGAPRSLQAEGAAQLRAEREATDLQVRARADLWLNTYQNANVGDQTLDLGEYLVEADTEQMQWRLGHQQLPFDSLIHSAFLRRGVSARFAPNPVTSLSGFALRSEPQTGARDLTGLSNETSRVAGAILEQQIWERADTTLALQAAVVSGEGNDLSASEDFSSLDPLHQGEAWSLGGELRSWQGRLRARAEWAGTRYDWNAGGLVLGNGRETDQARSFVLDWQSAGALAASEADTAVWSLGYDHRHVGTFFRSVAHVGLPSDRVLHRLRAGWRQGAWQASVSWARQTTNANDLPQLASLGLHQTDAFVAWYAPPPEGDLPWYGQVSVTANLSNVTQKQRSTPTGFLGTTANNRSWQTGLTLALAQEAWSSSLGLGRGAYIDRTLPALSSDSNTLRWDAQWRLGESWSVGPAVEWSRLRATASGQRETVRTASLFTDFWLIPQRLSGNLNVGVNLSRRSVDSQLETNRYATGEVRWRLKEARANRAGWDLKLSFSHQDFTDVLDTTRSGRGNQVFLGVHMILPVTTRD